MEAVKKQPYRVYEWFVSGVVAQQGLGEVSACRSHLKVLGRASNQSYQADHFSLGIHDCFDHSPTPRYYNLYYDRDIKELQL